MAIHPIRAIRTSSTRAEQRQPVAPRCAHVDAHGAAARSAMAKKLGLHEFRWDWTPPFIVSTDGSERPVRRRELRVPLPHRRSAGERRGRSLVHVISPDLTALQDKPGRRSAGPPQLRRAVLAGAVAAATPRCSWAGADEARFTSRATAARHGPAWTATCRPGPTKGGRVKDRAVAQPAAATA